MENNHESTPAGSGATDIKTLVQGAIDEYIRSQQSRTEPALKAELMEERTRREQLERKLNELAEENRRSRKQAEEAERTSAIRMELQKLGVSKVDLAFKAVRDDIVRNEEGRLLAKTESGDVPMREYLTRFVTENPELLPSRIQGGSGAGSGHSHQTGGSVDIDKIRPGMSAEELERVRREIARVAQQTMRGM